MSPSTCILQRLKISPWATEAGRRRRHLGRSLAATAGRAPPPRTAAIERNLRPRQLRHCQKRGDGMGKTKRGKGTRLVALVDCQHTPLRAQLANASPVEIMLRETTPAQVRVSRWGRGRPRQKATRFIADCAHDSNPQRERLQRRGIELQMPHRRHRERWWRQNGRKLRRFRRREKSSAPTPCCRGTAASECATTAFCPSTKASFTWHI